MKNKGFTLLADLKAKVLASLGYHNQTMAGPFCWTYTGRRLTVQFAAHFSRRVISGPNLGFRNNCQCVVRGDNRILTPVTIQV